MVFFLLVFAEEKESMFKCACPFYFWFH